MHFHLIVSWISIHELQSIITYSVSTIKSEWLTKIILTTSFIKTLEVFAYPDLPVLLHCYYYPGSWCVILYFLIDNFYELHEIIFLKLHGDASVWVVVILAVYLLWQLKDKLSLDRGWAFSYMSKWKYIFFSFRSWYKFPFLRGAHFFLCGGWGSCLVPIFISNNSPKVAWPAPSNWVGARLGSSMDPLREWYFEGIRLASFFTRTIHFLLVDDSYHGIIFNISKTHCAFTYKITNCAFTYKITNCQVSISSRMALFLQLWWV